MSIDIDGETTAKVNSFKYIGTIKTSTGSCSEDIKAIGRAKKATMELDTIWKDRGIRKELKMKLVKALIWPVITYGAEGWTLKKDDERRLEAAERGPFKCYVTQLGGGGVSAFPEKRYEGVRFNVISVTRGWVGVKFPGKKC